MGREKSSEDFEQGRADGHKHESWHYDHPWSSGAGLGPSKPTGSDDYNKGVDSGSEQRKQGK